MVAYAWKPGTPGAWKGGALKVGSWGPLDAGGSAPGFPALSATFTASPLVGNANFTPTFTVYVSGSANTVDLDIDGNGTYEMSLGPLVNATASPNYQFTSTGFYTVKLLVDDGSQSAIYTRISYIEVLGSAIGALGGGAGGLSFDMHGGLAGTRTSRSATAFGLRKKRRSWRRAKAW